MKIGLGIDTGGTYTDCVLYDFDENKVLFTAKALTTKNNLVEGIVESLKKLPLTMLSQTKLVSLSTTLATNACVEEKFAQGRVILLGYHPKALYGYGGDYGLPQTDEVISFTGGHDMQGNVVDEPDWTAIKAKVMELKSNTDAFGIVESWAIRNPEFEIKAKELISQWTGLPVVCGHELSGEVNSLRRAVTTLLNARLIPLIYDLIKSVEDALEHMDIKAPLMIVRSDGTLMSREFALNHPVETLLSGPAASVVGAVNLSGFDNAVAIDMGGTTTDLALIKNGVAECGKNGVTLGRWKTGTKAVGITTMGLGGDSHICLSKNEQLTIGPRKVMPLALYAKLNGDHPLDFWLTKAGIGKKSYNTCEFFMLNDESRISKYADVLSEYDYKIIKVLKKQSLSAYQLAQEIDDYPFLLKTEILENTGIIMRAALTPTDLMHDNGTYTPWNSDASKAGIWTLAQKMNIDRKVLCENILYLIEKKIYDTAVLELLQNESIEYDKIKSLLDIAYDKNNEDMNISFHSPYPLVGIGAPTKEYIENPAKALNTKYITPLHAEVANAVGAITGCIVGEATVLIEPNFSMEGISGYTCHSKKSFKAFDSLSDAKVWAEMTASKEAMDIAKEMGALSPKITLENTEHNTTIKSSGVMLDMRITAKAR